MRDGRGRCTCASKKGRKPNTTDLGVEEWRTPVGRAETTRKGEGEEERVTDDDHDSHARKSERGEEGRERRDQGRQNTQKPGGEGASIDFGTGGVRGSDERGDRRAEERQKRVQTDGEWERGDRGQRRQRQNGQEGEMCSVGKEAKDLRRLPSPPCTCRVASFVCGVDDGWSCVCVMANRILHSKRRKKKAFATHH
jgi:hypothetical protein